ncbi:MAG: hypothetical protein K6F94_06785 [Bacteroidaceae bacterium]|nr:hypothetical protein [Bacteroidaceae bacterium]
MKKKLLSLIALSGAMFMSTSAFAQWAEPVKPSQPSTQYEGTWAAPVDSGQYYIYNVGAGMFLGGGQTWGTRAIILMDSVVSVSQDAAKINNVSGNTTANYVLPFMLTKDEEIDNGFYIKHLNTSKATASAGSFVGEGGSQAWIDGNADRRTNYGQWTIVANADGSYRMTNIFANETQYPDSVVAFGVDLNNYACGWSFTWTDLAVEPTSDNNIAASLDWRFVSVDQYESVKAYVENYKTNILPAFQSQYQLWEARTKLYNTYVKALADAEAAEVSIDESVAEAEAVYTNSAATIEEMEAANTALSAAVNAAIFAKQFTGTADDPQEVTDICLVNANFDQGNINGWTCTFVSGTNATNVGYQSASYTNNGTTLTEAGSTVNEDEAPAFLSKFIEAWKNDASPWTIGDAELSQTILGLPTGVYKLTCDANAVQQYTGHEGLSNPVTGVKLFIATDNGKEVFQEIATGNGNPEHFSVTFTCPKGVKALTFGLKTENATANWIAADNFRIYYFGDSGDMVPEMLILMNQVKDAENTGISVDDNANSEVLAAYMAALEEAQGVIELGATATSEQCEAATAKLKAAMDAAKQSIKDYNTLQAYIAEAEDLTGKCTDAGLVDAADALTDLTDEWEVMYDEKTATKEQIDALAGVAHQTMIQTIGDAEIPVGTDLTFLLENPGFTVGTTANPIGWTINEGGLTELRTSTHNIEKYHDVGGKYCDISQTIANMPAGVYDVTLQGFVRHDGSDKEKTWLYGGITKAYLIDLNEDATQKVSADNRLYIEGMTSMGDANYDNTTATDEEGNALYQCNGMTGAYYWFQATNPNTEEPYYTNHVKVILDKKGDLTIGIHCESLTDWVIFDNFAIKFLGMDTEPLINTLNAKVESLNTLIQDENARLTAKATELGNTIPDNAQKAIDDDDSDAIIAMIQEVDNAIEYVKEGNTICDAFISLVSEYNEYAMSYVYDQGLEPTDEAFPALLEKYSSYDPFTNDFSDFADNDAVKAAMQSLRDGWVPYVMSAATDATVDAPVDVTLAVTNANFVNFIGETSTDGWVEASDQAAAINAGVAEFFNKNYDFSQTIKGLTPGYYTVCVDAFYRAGLPEAAAKALDADTLAHNAVMYANTKEIELKDIFVGAQETALGVDGEVEASYLVDGETATRYIPNSLTATATYFETGEYTNSITVHVDEDGILTIGLKKKTLVADDWTPFNNWQLYYLGTTEPDAVKAVEAETTAAGKAIFNLAGQKVSKAQKGIYIIGGRKVVVK